MRKAVVLNHYRLLSSVYEVCVYHFRSSAADVIHLINPFHLIIRFELFGYALTLCHLLYKPRKHIFCLFVEVSKVSVQFATCQQIEI